ncbi:MAG: hypothetical protein ACK56I_25060, partial [bacterium]
RRPERAGHRIQEDARCIELMHRQRIAIRRGDAFRCDFRRGEQHRQQIALGHAARTELGPTQQHRLHRRERRLRHRDCAVAANDLGGRGTWARQGGRELVDRHIAH